MVDMAQDARKVPRRVSKTLVVVMLVVAGVFVAAGVAATAENAILPFAQGQLFARERHLSRDSVALAIHIGVLDADGDPSRAAGALVTLYSEGDEQAIAAEAADREGRVLFHLRPGTYHGVVEHQEMTGERDFALRQDTRVVLVFDAEGELHVFRHDRQEIRDRGETASLYVSVRQADGDGGATPVEGVHVSVVRADGDSSEPVARGLTGPRGFAVFNLHHATYGVTIETPDGVTGAARVVLDSDHVLAFIIDEEGNVHVRSGDAPPSDRTTTSPTRASR